MRPFRHFAVNGFSPATPVRTGGQRPAAGSSGRSGGSRAGHDGSGRAVGASRRRLASRSSAAASCAPSRRGRAARRRHRNAQPRRARRRSRRPGDSRRSAPTPSVPAAREACGCASPRASRAPRDRAHPPTCAVVLTSPEASPASSGVAPDIATFISAGNAIPAPMPSSSIEGSTSLEVAAVDAARARTAPGRP